MPAPSPAPTAPPPVASFPPLPGGSFHASPMCAHPMQAQPVKDTNSPLILADRLLTLAQDVDLAGYRQEALHLVNMVYAVLDNRGTALPAQTRVTAAGRPARARGRQAQAFASA